MSIEAQLQQSDPSHPAGEDIIMRYTVQQCDLSEAGDCDPAVWFWPSTGQRVCEKHKKTLDEVMRLQGDAVDWQRLSSPKEFAAKEEDSPRKQKKVNVSGAGLCYFCERREAHPLEAFQTQQRRFIKEKRVSPGQSGFRTYERQYQYTTNNFPRCIMCASIHKRLKRELISIILCALGWFVLGGFLLFVLFSEKAYGGRILMVHLIATLVGVPIAWLVRRRFLLRSAGTRGTFWEKLSSFHELS